MFEQLTEVNRDFCRNTPPIVYSIIFFNKFVVKKMYQFSKALKTNYLQNSKNFFQKFNYLFHILKAED